jgi:hypothetical protein
MIREALYMRPIPQGVKVGGYISGWDGTFRVLEVREPIVYVRRLYWWERLRFWLEDTWFQCTLLWARLRRAAREAWHHWMGWHEWRGSLDGRPTMYIKRLLQLPFWRRAGKLLSCRVDLHKFVAADDEGCFHTHPAYAIRLVLWGGYVEQAAHDDQESGVLRTEHVWWEPGDIGLVRPELAHRVARLLKGRASYSLWLRGPICADVKLVGDGWAKQKRTAAGLGDPYNREGKREQP